MRFIMALTLAVTVSACQMSIPTAVSQAAPEVAPGEVLPFGKTARACGLPKRDLGTMVDKFPREGRPQWQLFDTDPTSTSPRTQFITGFSDGCPRQLTAALVVFGSAGVHEALFLSGGKNHSETAADAAYAQIKTRTCGVAAKVPCPANRLAKLEKELTFATAYSRFGGVGPQLELLLRSGDLVAEGRRD